MRTIQISLADYDALVARCIALQADVTRLGHAIRGDFNVALCEWEPGDSKTSGQWLPVLPEKARAVIDADMCGDDDERLAA